MADKKHKDKGVANDAAEVKARISRRQKYLIPVNIITMILAFVAVISLIFAPIISVDMNGLGDKVIAAAEEMEITVDNDMQSTANMLNGMDGKLSLSAYDLLEFSLAEDKNVYVADKASDVLEEMDDKVFVGVAVSMAVEKAEENTDIDLSGVDSDKLAEKLSALETVNPDESDAAINDFASEIRNQLGSDIVTDSVYDEIIKYVREAYNDAIEYSEDGKFSLETAICVALSKQMSNYKDTNNNNQDNPSDEKGNGFVGDKEENVQIPEVGQKDISPESIRFNTAAVDDFTSEGSGESVAKDGKIYTNYADLITAMLNGETSDASESEEFEKYTEMIGPYMIYIVCVLFGFAVWWAILFLFAFFRLFMKNKCFTMWYVKLFGGIPCMIFFVAPLLAKWILGSYFGKVALAALIGTVSSFAWVSGICYLALWFVSIFIAYPIKRKIRADQRLLS